MMFKFTLVFVIIFVASCTCAPINQSSKGFWCKLWRVFCPVENKTDFNTQEIASTNFDSTTSKFTEIIEEFNFKITTEVPPCSHKNSPASSSSSIAKSSPCAQPTDTHIIEAGEVDMLNTMVPPCAHKTPATNPRTESPPCEHTKTDTPLVHRDDLRAEENNDLQPNIAKTILITAPVTCPEGYNKDPVGKCKKKFGSNQELGPQIIIGAPCREGYKEDQFGNCRKIYSK